MSDWWNNIPGVAFNFTQQCSTCGETVQYEAGKRLPHPCPEDAALVISAPLCDMGAGELQDRITQALDDAALLQEYERDDA